MFQFRRFPTYTYLIQCTLHGYCPCGLPHSEIRGLTDICSSPRLIAACHVLHRLLMPRHSPCALFSLTYRRRNSLHSVSASRKLHIRSFLLLLRLRPTSLGSEPGLGTGDPEKRLLDLSEKILVLSRIMQASQILEIVIVTLRPLWTLFHNYSSCHTFVWRLSVALLFTCITLFSFQGAESSSF